MRRNHIERFQYTHRVVHWTVGLSFLLLLFTGLAFSYPKLFWLSAFLGGGAAARVVHPWAGIVFSVSLVLMILLWIKEMMLGKADWEWLAAIGHYAKHDRAKVPDAGKYNGGQKLYFWVESLLGVVLLLTGLPLWFPGGIGGLEFGPALLTTMRLLHYLSALGAGLFLIVHIYLSTIAYPGTLGAMLSGSVSRGWAKLHHPLWYKEKAGG